jgi:hypothetical protein
MKTLLILPFVFLSTAAFANIDQCESGSQQSLPPAKSKVAARVKLNAQTAPAVGPKLHLTPYIPARPFAIPARVKITAASRHDCLAPVSMPPGAIRIGYSIPYVGPRPEWGTPTPSYLAMGPRPVWPGSPDDFRPVAYAPPGFVPPAPTELPEPSTVALMLLGALLMSYGRPRHLAFRAFENHKAVGRTWQLHR